MRDYLTWEEQGILNDESEEMFEYLVTQWCVFIKQKKYYTRYVDAEGIIILGGDEITETEFRIARGIVLDMTSKRPELREYLTLKPSNPFRMVLLPEFKTSVELPEAINLNKKSPAACGAGFCFSAKYSDGISQYWNPFIHEFAHAIHLYAIRHFGDPNFDAKLKSLYEKAMAVGLWKGTYAATNYREYWAEGVTHWFWKPPNIRVAQARGTYFETRQDFIDYDPELAALIAEWLPAIELTFE